MFHSYCVIVMGDRVRGMIVVGDCRMDLDELWGGV